MNELLCDLFSFTTEHYGLPPQCAEYRVAERQFDHCMKQVDQTMGRKFHEDLYEAVMHYMFLEQQDSFRLGLRLGLQLQTL